MKLVWLDLDSICKIKKKIEEKQKKKRSKQNKNRNGPGGTVSAQTRNRPEAQPDLPEGV
jgi:hypothetical protein